jgi:hypothetical protein
MALFKKVKRKYKKFTKKEERGPKKPHPPNSGWNLP